MIIFNNYHKLKEQIIALILNNYNKNLIKKLVLSMLEMNNYKEWMNKFQKDCND